MVLFVPPLLEKTGHTCKLKYRRKNIYCKRGRGYELGVGSLRKSPKEEVTGDGKAASPGRAGIRSLLCKENRVEVKHGLKR